MAKTTPNFQESLQNLFRLLDEACGRDFVFTGPQNKQANPRNKKSLEQLREWLGSDHAKLRKGYMNTEAFFNAYLFYFFPLHLPEIFWIQTQLKDRTENFSNRSWVDVGCGPGTASISMALWNKYNDKKDPKEIVLIDQSKRALVFAKAALQSICPDTKILCIKMDLRNVVDLRREIGSLGTDWDAVFISHLLNEFGSGPRAREPKEKLLNFLIRSLCQDRTKIYIVEPAHKSPTIDLMELGDELLEEGASILAPCPSSRKTCPMLKDRKGWCYAQPPRIDFRALGLAQTDKNIEKALKIKLTHSSFSYLVYMPSGDQHLTEKHRISVANDNAKTALFCDGGKIVKRPRKEYFRGQWVTASSNATEADS